jgi:4-amino-4-deoxy-L-arabinose transferase-like glycosyltransferase
VPLALAVAGVWYAPVWYAHGRKFFDEFIVQHHFARFVSNKFHHPQRFYFYLLIMPLLALPWTPLLFAALKDLATELRAALRHSSDDEAARGDGAIRNGVIRNDGATQRGDSLISKDAAGGGVVFRLRLFAFAWLVVPVLFFSASQSKLPGYVLPALPGAAVLAGCELWRFARGARRTWDVRAVGVLMIAAAVAAIYYSAHARTVSLVCASACAAPLALGGAWVALARGARARIAAVIVGASLLSVMLMVNCAQGEIVRRESVRDLLRDAAERGYADAPVVNLYDVERSAEFYASGRLVYDDEGEPESFDGVGPVADYARARGRVVLVIVPVKSVPSLMKWSPLPAELIGDNGANAVVALHGERQ